MLNVTLYTNNLPWFEPVFTEKLISKAMAKRQVAKIFIKGFLLRLSKTSNKHIPAQ
jgi:hypothetical protein